VVIHLYNCLLSKAVAKVTNSGETPKSAKTNYQERQTMLVENDPSLTCLRIERNIKDIEYSVHDNITTGSLPTNKSHLITNKEHVHTYSYLPRSLNLNKDGDGDNCSLYFNGVEETGDKYLHVTSNFALAHLCHLNMLTDLPQYFPGISYPYLYLRGLHSVFHFILQICRCTA